MSNEERLKWLETHCICCKESFKPNEEVYPHDEEEDDSCICHKCNLKINGKRGYGYTAFSIAPRAVRYAIYMQKL